jgi:hypothetical protein
MAMARCKAPGTARESAQARMGPARGSAQRGRLLLTALAAAGGCLVLLPARCEVADGAPGLPVGSGWRTDGGFALTLRGGGKSKETSRKRGGAGEGSSDKKRARDEDARRPRGRAAAEDKVDEDEGDDESTSGSDSADELAYSDAGAGDGHVQRVGAHNLGTAPIPSAPRAPAGGAGGDDDTTSESYPGCYSESSDLVEEQEDWHSGPQPTREELIRQIRDRPFNTSFVRFARPSSAPTPAPRPCRRRMSRPHAPANACDTYLHARPRWRSGKTRRTRAWPQTRRRPCASWRTRLKHGRMRRLLPLGRRTCELAFHVCVPHTEPPRHAHRSRCDAICTACCNSRARASPVRGIPSDQARPRTPETSCQPTWPCREW